MSALVVLGHAVERLLHHDIPDYVACPPVAVEKGTMGRGHVSHGGSGMDHCGLGGSDIRTVADQGMLGTISGRILAVFWTSGLLH